MKNHILISLSAVILSFMSCGEKTNPHLEEVTKNISSVQKKYAPDKRVAMFQVEALAQNKNIVLRGESNLPAAKQELMSTLSAKDYTIIDSIKMLPAAELGDKIYGVVNLSACNIRSKPKHSAELGTQSTLGTALRVYKSEGSWFWIQTPDDYFGWLDAGGFTAMTATEYQAWQNSDKVIYLKDFGFSLAAPTEQAGRVSDLLEGNILKFLETTGSYTG